MESLSRSLKPPVIFAVGRSRVLLEPDGASVLKTKARSLNPLVDGAETTRDDGERGEVVSMANEPRLLKRSAVAAALTPKAIAMVTADRIFMVNLRIIDLLATPFA